jgi:hypothetical protein
VQQIARAAEDLNRLTENLQRLLERFNLGGVAGQHAAAQAHPTSKGQSAKAKSTVAVRENGTLVQHENA